MAKSLPVRECGLKCFPTGSIPRVDFVTPRAGVWIEISRTSMIAYLVIVTPRAGVWIEIEYGFRISDISRVTPRAGVWIEILLTPMI